jgi:proteasome lid subunit RPN8/RPN11
MKLTDDAATVIREHAAATYPDECCGALIGRAGGRGEAVVREALPLPNTTAEGPRRRFLVAARDYRQAEARARAAGAALVGFYHSHPDHPAQPSAHDLEQAWPNLAYAIVAVRQGTPGELRVWRLRDDRSAFEEEALTWPSPS